MSRPLQSAAGKKLVIIVLSIVCALISQLTCLHETVGRHQIVEKPATAAPEDTPSADATEKVVQPEEHPVAEEPPVEEPAIQEPAVDELAVAEAPSTENQVTDGEAAVTSLLADEVAAVLDALPAEQTTPSLSLKK